MVLLLSVHRTVSIWQAPSAYTQCGRSLVASDLGVEYLKSFLKTIWLGDSWPLIVISWKLFWIEPILNMSEAMTFGNI